jgi:hypothetical protein
MTFAPNCLASKRWEKVGFKELRSTPSKQEIDPYTLFPSFSPYQFHGFGFKQRRALKYKPSQFQQDSFHKDFKAGVLH